MSVECFEVNKKTGEWSIGEAKKRFYVVNEEITTGELRIDNIDLIEHDQRQMWRRLNEIDRESRMTRWKAGAKKGKHR